jgi:hypothetical protein
LQARAGLPERAILGAIEFGAQPPGVPRAIVPVNLKSGVLRTLPIRTGPQPELPGLCPALSCSDPAGSGGIATLVLAVATRADGASHSVPVAC